MDQAQVTPVAVIGMACRLPQGIDSPDKLWEALLRGDDLITEIPADRWDADEYYDPEFGVPGRSVSRWGGFLEDVAGFDPEFFGISEREATAIDPQHRLLMQTSWEAVEHAGVAPKSLGGSLTGVFVGMCHDDYAFVTGDAGALDDAYAFTGTAFSMASGRVSYSMGLRGPAMTVDTACSSSLLAVHIACRSLHEGESNLALAGGCLVMLEPRVFTSASAQGMLSPTGHCRTFDAAADGFVRSEGCAMVLLKRLPDALRDGDRILAVLRGTATNQDGRTDTIATPSLDAQVVAYRAALAAAGVDADTVGMVEAHGTGTPVGDPIEFASLAQVYGSNGNRCALASAKSNLGHTEAAAGAVGIIKAILSLQHGLVPPMVHHTRLPDELARIETGLFVPQQITPWPTNGPQNGHGPRRAAVSSYGMSGSNVHAILEQAPEHPHNEAKPSTAPQLFGLSATSAEALRQTSRRLADWIDGHTDTQPVDLAYTLARRRGHRPVRTGLIAADHSELIERLRELADGDSPCQTAVGQDDRGPVWIFSGQGSQWPAMGADLLANEPVFAATVAAAEPLIAAESGFSVTEAMTAPQTVTGIDRVQPTLFAMHVALAATMKSYGVAPGAVIGHSLGEVAAAVVAGALSLQDGARVICRRSRLCTRIAGVGAMAAVELPAQQVREELAGRDAKYVVIAVVASPQSTVIGGAPHTVRDLVRGWEERGVLAREVAVDVASHTPQVDPILDELSGALADVTPLAPELPYYSATLFDPRERPVCDARYWVDNLRHAVRFSAAVCAALEDGYRVFGELSPHPLLTRAVEQTAASVDIPVAAIAGMRRDQPLPHGLRALVAELHSAGAAVDFSRLYPGGRLVDAPLPSWANRRLLLAADGARRPAGAGTPNIVAVHPFLGPHVRLMEEPERHAWTAEVGTAALPWLGDHRIHRVAALPGAAYCEMALAAAATVLGEDSEVRDIRFEQMLLLDDETPVGVAVSVQAPGAATFEVETLEQGDRVRRASAALHAVADPGDGQDRLPAHDIDALLLAHPRRLDGDQLRDWFDARGVQFGSAFTGLLAAYISEGTIDAVLAEIALPGAIRTQQAGYHVHPALLDACFQSVAAHPAVQETGNGGLLLPLGARRLRRYASTRTARYCRTTVTACGTNVEADIDVMDEHGTVLLVVRGLLMGTGFSESADQDRLLGERLLTIEWQRRELPQSGPEAGAPPAGTWLLVEVGSALEHSDLLAMELTDALALHGAHCVTIGWPAQADRLAGSSRGVAGVVVLTGPGSDRRVNSDYVRHLVGIARELADLGNTPRLYVVTRNAQQVLADDPVNLEQGGLRGLLRVIGAEHPHLRPTHVDIDELTEAEQLTHELLAGSEEDETAWRNDEWHTARLCPAPLDPDERRTTLVSHERDGMRMQIRTRGDMQTMELVAFERVSPGPGQIEVAVTASSINFADVLGVFGRYRGFEPLPGLGTDFAGVVTAVGPDVTDLEVGDRVGGLCANGCWATFVICEANLAVKIPAGLSDAEAAAVSTASATAWCGLHDLARIKAGDKVLIHSATGGVGRAAIAIAGAAGAEIFATAGSPDRRKMLRDMGIKHVYDSRSIEFAEQIRRDTDGKGVDIVLNSLTGAAQRAGVDLLAFGGRFVEIGKRDIYGDTRLGLFPFRRNLTFFGLDLWLMSITHPNEFRELLSTVYRLTAQGSLPMPSSTHYPLAEAATAIRVMGAAEHTGKLILDIPQAGNSSVVMPPEQTPVFRPDGAYVITGGLGGLGLFLTEKMASANGGAGAGRIVLSSRSAPSRKVMETIELIRATGSDIVVECGDIALAGAAERLVAAATATGLPLRGVLHAAAVVEDATLTNVTDELIEQDWAPKVRGAWNLHRATASAPLDWFCSFSSAAALLGSPGQGAYAAANSWLDAFTHWRRAQGLPATSIAWGAWAEIGRGAGLAESGDTTMIAPDEGAYAFEALLRHTRAYSGYAPIVGSPWLTALAQHSRFADAFRSVGNDRSDHSKLRAELHELPLDEWPTRLRRLISEQVVLILRRAVDPDRPLSQYGLDSLGNLELRTRIETETGIRIHSTDVTTVRDLADHLSETLAPRENKTENATANATATI